MHHTLSKESMDYDYECKPEQNLMKQNIGSKGSSNKG